MSKSKSKTKGGKESQKSEVLTKVKDTGVTKPAQNAKESKSLAKQVTTKDHKKKKPVKELTPEPSSSEEESDSSVDSSEEESDEETAVKAKKPVAAGKTNGVKVATAADSSDESESDFDVPATGANTRAGPVADSDASSDESDDDNEPKNQEGSDSEDSESESEAEEKPSAKGTGKGAALSVKKKADSDDSAEESDDASASSDDESGSDADSEAEEVKTVNKRKAEEEETPAAKKAKTELDTSKGANLFIGSLSWNVDEGWLREEFESFGELSGVRVMTDRQTGRSKGFGYVEFVNPADAARAHAEKQGAMLDGRAMNVDFANARPNPDQKQENRRKSYNDQVSEPSETLFVGNLSFDVGQDAVSSAFAEHGTILGVRLPTDRETGQPKGFGYVTFASVEEAQAAMEAMQGFYLENRPIRLDFSQPRPQNSDSPARGGFGGRGRGGFGGRGGRGGGRGDFRGGRGGARGGRGGNTTNRGGFSDFSGRKTTF